MWNRADVGTWYLKPKQKTALEFLQATQDPFFEASRRYGKTTTILGYCIQEMKKNAGLIVRWCEPWKSQCREIVMTEVDKIQAQIPEDDRLKWHGVDSYYYLPSNNARLYLRGVNEDRGESARGTAANIIVADELGTWKEPTYILNEVLGPQLLTTNGKLIYAGTPPRNFTHAYYDLKEQAQLDGRFIQRLIYDQEIASWEAVEKAVNRAGGWESPAVQREYLCKKAVDNKFSIIPEWDDKYIQEVPKDEYFTFYLKYDGLDIGIRDLTVILLAYYDFKRAKLIVLDEIVMNGAAMTTKILAQANRTKETEHFGVKWTELPDGTFEMDRHPHRRLRRISDIDLLLINDLTRLHGLYYEATDKGELEEMVNEVRIWVGGGKVLVNPRCAILIDSLRYGLWDEKRKEWERSDRLGHFDALAALMYLIRNVDTRTNPVPADYGKPEDEHFYSEEAEKTDDKLRQMFNLGKRGRI